MSIAAIKKLFSLHALFHGMYKLNKVVTKTRKSHSLKQSYKYYIY